jgi:hypothetical protein
LEIIRKQAFIALKIEGMLERSVFTMGGEASIKDSTDFTEECFFSASLKGGEY